MSYPDYRVDDAAFRELTQFIRNKTGISLEESKRYLVETRLGPLLGEFGLGDYMALCQKAMSDRLVLNRVVDEITTNETSWFRDSSPFDLLKYKFLPDLMDRREGDRRPINIWSAACSTGQEVYSIAMVCREILPPEATARMRLFGTDISEQAVATASRGVYSDFEIQRGLSPQQLDRYFHRTAGGWQVNDELRAMAVFKQMNLLDQFVGLGQVDVIFCRNVAIYFDASTRKTLFDRLGKTLGSSGSLVVGASETLHGVTDFFERREHQRSSYYVPAVQ